MSTMDVEKLRKALGAKYDPDDKAEPFVVEGVPYTLYMRRNADYPGLNFTAHHEPTDIRIASRFTLESDDVETWRMLLADDIKGQHDTLLEWAALVKR